MSLVHSIKTLPLWREVYTVDCMYSRHYTVVKFDGLFNVESVYQVLGSNGGTVSCPCFQGKFGRCRHRPLVILFEETNRINKRWFFDWELKVWYMPINMRR